MVTALKPRQLIFKITDNHLNIVFFLQYFIKVFFSQSCDLTRRSKLNPSIHNRYSLRSVSKIKDGLNLNFRWSI